MAGRMNLRWILADVALLVLLGWAMQHSSGRLWGAMFVLLLGLNAVWFGVDAVRRREDASGGSEEGVRTYYSTLRGWTAVLSGGGLALAGGILVVSGLAMLTGMGQTLMGLLRMHGGFFLGLVGLWLAAFGLVRMAGDVESHNPEDSDWLLRQFLRLSGLPAMLFGLVLVLAGFFGYVPLLGWIR